MCNFANLLLRGTWPFLRGEDTILSFLLSFLSSSRFSLASSWAIRLSASARVARRHTISSLCAKDCLSRSATLPKRDPVSHSSISSVKENCYLPCCKDAATLAPTILSFAKLIPDQFHFCSGRI